MKLVKVKIGDLKHGDRYHSQFAAPGEPQSIILCPVLMRRWLDDHGGGGGVPCVSYWGVGAVVADIHPATEVLVERPDVTYADLKAGQRFTRKGSTCTFRKVVGGTVNESHWSYSPGAYWTPSTVVEIIEG